MSLILDTGPLFALLDRDDPAHDRAAALVDGIGENLVVPSPVLVEVNYWCRKLLDARAWNDFLHAMSAGMYHLFNLDDDGYRRAGELEAQYSKLGLGLVDAAVIATCEAWRHRGHTGPEALRKGSAEAPRL